MKFIIKGELPGLNEYVASINRNRYNGNKLKQETQDNIMWQIKQQCQFSNKIEKPVIVHFLWVSKDKRRDIDNVSHGQKYVLDSLVKIGILPNDNRKWVKGLYHDFEIDKENPRVEIVIEEYLTVK